MEPPLIPQQQRQQQEKLPVRQGVVRSLSYEEPRMPSPPVEKQLCPAIQKLMVRSTDLHPLSELPEQRPCEADGTHPMGAVLSGPIQPGSPQNIRTSHGTQSASRTQNLLEKLQSSPGAVNKYNATAPTPASPAALSAAIPTAPQLGYFNGPFPPPRGHQAPGKEQCPLGSPALPLPGGQASNPGALPPQELLRKLQAVQQEQQLQVAHRPALAAKFPVVAQSSRTGKPLEAWISKASSMEKQAPLLQVNWGKTYYCNVAPFTVHVYAIGTLCHTHFYLERARDPSPCLHTSCLTSLPWWGEPAQQLGTTTLLLGRVCRVKSSKCCKG
jgi:mRNA-decapping enzyme 1B